MKKVKVTQIKTAIRKSDMQQATLRGLGLRGIGKSRVHNLTPQIAGMIRKVDFIVKVEDVK